MKRLPEKEEFEALLKLPHKWDKERKGIVFTANNGNKLFLPAFGRCYGTCVDDVGNNGRYWLAMPIDEYYVWNLYFCSDKAYMCAINHNYSLPVRFVSDTLSNGYIDMGTGVYWALENYHDEDKEYFTWDEAMIIKDKVNDNAPEEHLLNIPPIDWEQRRYEIAKVILLRLSKDRGPEFSAQQAVKYADEFIKQLKQQDNENDNV